MLSNLIGELAKRRISNQELANFLGVHRNSIYNKLMGETDFTLSEAFKIYNRYFQGLDFIWLFTPALTNRG